jgi:hypothetical protein
MSNTYKLGTSVKVSAAFFDEDGAAFDPATVIAMVKTPDGAETSYTYGSPSDIVQDSLGNYHLWIETPAAGTYAYRWKGDDAVHVANESTFDVDESAFATP